MSNGKKQSGTKRITRSQRRAQQRRQKQMQSLGLMIVGAVVVVAALIIATNAPTPASEEIVLAPPRDHPMANENTMGDPNAPVVMEDFSDFQCGHCRNFYRDNEPYIIENYIATGKVYFIYRSWGDSPAGDSGRAAEAAYCAGDQDKFWDMHDIIYANFSGGDSGGYSTKRLVAMAEAIDLDVDEFESCLKGNKYEDRVDEDFALATEKGVTGTPTFFINDQVISGNESLNTFTQVIDEELAIAGE
jgi:protein-disulfide isomerase